MSQEKEIWKDIAGFEGYYQVSNLGRVRSLDRLIKRKNGHHKRKGKILAQSSDKKGYKRLQLHKNGMKSHKVHRLVASAFIESYCQNLQINHIDGDKSNNNLCNLEWVTPEQNTKHALKTGLISIGEKSKHSKIDEIQALTILTMPANKRKQLQETYGLSLSAIQHIQHGRSWKHLNKVNPIFTNRDTE